MHSSRVLKELIQFLIVVQSSFKLNPIVKGKLSAEIVSKKEIRQHHYLMSVWFTHVEEEKNYFKG